MRRDRWSWRARAQGRAADTGSACSAGCISLVEEALRLFQLAAAQGYPQALFNVAAGHEHGLGVRKNKAEAIRWYMRAQAAGHPFAAANLQRLRA